MARHVMLYWKLKTVEYRFYGEPLDHIAHDQLARAEPGDVIWIVTVRGGDLLLAGRLQVGAVLDESEADDIFDEYGLWQARWHVTAAHSTAEPMQLINLTERDITLSLRFQSPADRLRINQRGRLNTLSLYHLRQLTDDSGGLLNYTWYKAKGALDAVEHIDIEPDQFIYAEGKTTVRRRVVRQRSAGLVNAAKARFAQQHGELRCEICHLSFAEVYGEIGAGYIEAHHPDPISELDGEHFTDVDGIVLVCANCHRMIHRKSPPYSIDHLRQIVQQRQRHSQAIDHTSPKGPHPL
jgi:predicted HNH restriction endonuclease